MAEPEFDSLGAILKAASEALRPPERLSVSEAAEKYRYVHNPGHYIGPWRNRMAPYLVEPMDELASLDYKGWVFVSASQSGKTDIGINWLQYSVLCDPLHMMLVEVSQTRASDFSFRRIDELHRHNENIRSQLRDEVGDDTVHRKRYQSGMMFNLSWPSSNELSGRPIPRLFLTDYDRMPPDIGREGSAFVLAQGRITTFGRHGMVAAESSPSFPVTDPSWSPSTPHEAPPSGGILSLYNQGDRRRWYWKCVTCEAPFEPTFALLKWDDKQPDAHRMAESAWMECPHCGERYRHEDSATPGKAAMNRSGRWLKDGQTWLADGTVVGDGPPSDTASFWLPGTAAAFKDWRTIVSKYLLALDQYNKTGLEETLKGTVNTDQAMPYTPRAHEMDRIPEKLQERAQDFGMRDVPAAVRFLIAAIDVQKYRFVVQVMGIGPGADIWVIDRFDIRHSLRPDTKSDRPNQFHTVLPGTYREDWKLLMREVIKRSYPLSDGSKRRMGIKATICDSRGMERATSNAYDFWRWLRDGPKPEDIDFEEWADWEPRMHDRFQLFAGTDKRVSYTAKIVYPDSGRSNRFAGARGEVPVLSVNVTTVKNQLDSILEREHTGTGRINFPDWLSLEFFKELCAEVKTLKGIWENPRQQRNESWDLFVMGLSLLGSRRHVGIDQLDWSKPPPWADEWDSNELVFNEETGESVAPKRPASERLEELAKKLA